MVPCPKIVKLYNSGMDGVNVMDQRTSVRIYLHIFFDLIDIAYVNRYLIYNMKHPNKLSLLDYKIVVAKKPEKSSANVETKRKNQPDSIDNHGVYSTDYQTL